MGACTLEMPTKIYGVIIVNGFVYYSQQVTAVESTRSRDL